MRTPIKVVIADDHEIFRNGLKLLFNNQNELELIDEAENGKHLIDIVNIKQPDIVITDIIMPVMDGIEASKIIKEKYPLIGVIALSMFNEEHLIVDMVKAGAMGYLLKNTTKDELIQAAKSVFNGGTYHCSATSNKLHQFLYDSKFNSFKNVVLTQREKDIIVLICKELSNKEIAAALDLSVRTIESYREGIQEKIGSRNMVGIVMYAIKTGLFKLKNSVSDSSRF